MPRKEVQYFVDVIETMERRDWEVSGREVVFFVVSFFRFFSLSFVLSYRVSCNNCRTYSSSIDSLLYLFIRLYNVSTVSK